MRIATEIRGPSRRCLFGLLLVLGLPAVSPAAEQALVLRLQGEKAAVAGRCDEALELLGRARAADPSDARAALVSGQCQIKLSRYADAVSTLEQAKRLAPDLPEVDLYLGMARYHAEDLGGAETALRAALRSLPERAEVHLYLGLLALQRGEAAEAAESLARSRLADPHAVEPIASFYEGLSHEAEGERRAAEAALRRARMLGKGTVWETQATAALERLGEGRPPPWKTTSPFGMEVLGERSQRWWVLVTAGMEYDDNVLLRGTDVHLPEEIDSDDDFRGVWSLETGYELLATHDWTVGLLGTYYGTAHTDLEDFDTHYPGLSAWIDRRLGAGTIARLQYDFAYAFVGDAWIADSDRFLIAHNWIPALYHDWGKAGNSRLFMRFIKRGYFLDAEDVPDCPVVFPDPTDPACGPAGVREDRARNRDGWGVSSGVDHAASVGGESLVLRAGYRFHHYDAEGSEYSYRGHEVQIGARLLLPFGLTAETFGSYTWRRYRHPSTYAYPVTHREREDDAYRVDAVIERPIRDNLMLSARYGYFNNDSNIGAFHYDRHLAGLYATVRFGP